MSDSFVYCWTDKKTNMLYVGSHKGSTEDGYICSSKHMLKEYNKRPEDFSRQILANGCYKEMLNFEISILKSAGAAKSSMFYNKHNGNGKVYKEYLLEEQKNKIKNTCKERQINKGRKRPDLVKINAERDRSGENNPMYGKSHSDSAKKQISKKRKELRLSSGENNPMYGKSRKDLSERNKSIKGKHWYNNGIKSKQLFENEIPIGWVKGRII